jgi:predicted DNA-binding helix-hairpin-helix protein
MDLRRRFELLSDAAVLDRDKRGGSDLALPGDPVGIRKVRLPGGGSTTLMRVMQTNACSLTCNYCPTFCGGKVKRVALKPEEVASTFADAHRRGIAQGLFLTSGVPGRPERATDRMLAALDLVRRREGFHGYVHLKLLPGAEPAQVERAVELADRVSVNLEAPGDEYLRHLAKEKKFSDDLLPKLEMAGRLSRERRRERFGIDRLGASTTTQFVVGGAGERDREILTLVARLERDRVLHHAHFSAFQPVVGTPMENVAPTPAMREARLYQAEHLMRDYGFRFDELVFEADGNLTLDHDPKTAWASAHPEHFPLVLEQAPYELLLRVPGIGPRSARTLVEERQRALPRDARDLRRLGIDAERAAYYLVVRGRRLARERLPEQLRLFRHGEHLTRAAFRTPVPPCAYR